ncbi:hypothetical protein [Bacteriovorax sp. Seq25_V]|uniref:hypothetical protein n=1 Tax=Bacteriovorax sp. Seq25_V TaxID=1201288 RepID=UPI00038A358C|nr:hypothetical protein [Bacteriovorax sp. Seq25_V]EQC43284.1 hypothetical protein M900_0146 [Bacteriovorax sp. Seq25_V]
MDSNTLIIVILLFLIFILLLVIGGIVVYLLMRNKQRKEEAPVNKESLANFGPNDFKKLFEDSKKDKEPIVGLCSICEKELIKSDHFETDNLHFCKEHFQTYTENKWEQITNQLTTADTPEAGIYIYNFKQNGWEKNKEPMYIQCEYKIDVTNDHIETYVQLYVIKEKAEVLKNQLEKERL